MSKRIIPGSRRTVKRQASSARHQRIVKNLQRIAERLAAVAAVVDAEPSYRTNADLASLRTAARGLAWLASGYSSPVALTRTARA